MTHPIAVKENAIKLRKKGYAFSEIKSRLGISKSLLSGWLRDVYLSPSAIKRLDTVVRKGRTIAGENKKAMTRLKIASYLNQATKDLSQLKLDKIHTRLVCALIYYCEGRKSYYEGVAFTNSDVRLVQVFLELFRNGFHVDEKKFRVCVHLHAYHNEKEIVSFWSRATHIPPSQFIRPYIKANTGKRIRNGYNGCVAVSYHDTDMARELLTTAEAFFKRLGPIS